MQNTATTPAAFLSPPVESPVESPVEKLVRETFMGVARKNPTIETVFGSVVPAWAPTEHDVARAITTALQLAGHLKEPHKCANPNLYGECIDCGADMIDQLRRLPGLTPEQYDLIETMATTDRPLEEPVRKLGKKVYRRVASLRARRRALNSAMARTNHPKHTDLAEMAALTFAINYIQETYTEPQV